MLLPHNEAKLRKCPLLTTKEDKLRLCLGNDCMMWRYAHPEKEGENDKGYCGISGKPYGTM